MDGLLGFLALEFEFGLTDIIKASVLDKDGISIELVLNYIFMI